jgi:hypothetical protein
MREWLQGLMLGFVTMCVMFWMMLLSIPDMYRMWRIRSMTK